MNELFALPGFYAAWLGSYRSLGTTYLQGSCSPRPLNLVPIRVSRHFGNYLSTLRNITEEQRYCLNADLHELFEMKSSMLCAPTQQQQYINYQLLCTDYYLFTKHLSPLHISSLKCSSSGGYSCTRAVYGTLTLYEISWWPVGTQLE